MVSPQSRKAPCAGRATWFGDALLALVLTGWYYREGATKLQDHLYDTFDQKQMIYNLEWIYHCFFRAGHPRDVFNLNAFYPNTNTLAWSDTLLGFMPPYAFFRAFTDNPILAFNFTAVLAAFAGVLGLFRLGRELTGRTAFIAGLIGGTGLLYASMEGHFQLKALSLLAWSIFFLVRFLRGSDRALPWFVALSCWTFLCSIYYAIMNAVFVATALAVAFLVGRRRFVLWLRERVSQIPLATAVPVIVGSLLPVGWVVYHYAQVKNQFGGYQMDEFVTFAARLGSLLDAPTTSLVYRSMYSHWGSHESRLAFGSLVWVFVILLALLWRRSRVNEAEGRIVLLLAFGALLGIVLALGPYERHALSRGVRVPLPAYAYIKVFPGFSALRTIGRFGVFSAVFMALLAEIGVRKALDLLDLAPGRARWGYVVVAALFLVDQTTILKPLRVDLIPRRPVYEAIKALTPPEAVVLELPITRQGHFETISWWHEQMLGSTVHWRRIPVGWTSLEPESLRRLKDSYSEFEAGRGSTTAFLNVVREMGVTHLVMDSDQVPESVAARLRQELAHRGYSETPLTARASLFGSTAAVIR